ncbi:hypothetical protein APS_1641 [Acetobacter pasteurianus subsp. pasteurianus LMG 1262 = NBRC 106471]|nr:hypothetical protein APS_1641 [Acetobacter pasteurianus subsp. pasteurianus LMG 1262 = NBRC 106471]
MGHAGVVQHTFGRGRLTCVNMRGNTDITNLGQIGCGGHENLQKTGQARMGIPSRLWPPCTVLAPVMLKSSGNPAAGNRPIDDDA